MIPLDHNQNLLKDYLVNIHDVYNIIVLVSLLVAVPSLSVTCKVISVDDGLVRTSTGVTVPAFSLTSYVVALKNTEITKII